MQCTNAQVKMDQADTPYSTMLKDWNSGLERISLTRYVHHTVWYANVISSKRDTNLRNYLIQP